MYVCTALHTSHAQTKYIYILMGKEFGIYNFKVT